MVEGFVGEDQDFEVDPVGDGKPVKLFEDWSDVMPGFGEGNESGSCVLDQLESVDVGGADAKEK